MPIDFKLGSKTIDIPAGAADYTIEDGYTLPVDVELLSIYPHAHYLAKDMKVFATLPDGTVDWLIWIKDWNFNWQDQYRYATPGCASARHGRDDALHVRQLRRPIRATRIIRRSACVYGPQSSDEMGDLWLRFVAAQPEDAARPGTVVHGERTARRTSTSRSKACAQPPADATWQGMLGTRYLEAGRGRKDVHLS